MDDGEWAYSQASEDNVDTTLWSQLVDSLRVDTQDENSEDYILSRVRVRFPYEAYKSQVSMMEHILLGVTNSENCLLESPTGTGKTAALLCSLLAWQNHCKRKRDWGWKIDEATEKAGCTCGFMQGDPQSFKILQWCCEKTRKFYLDRFTYEYVQVSEDANMTIEENSHSLIPSPKKKKTEIRQLKAAADERRKMENLCRYCIRTNFKEYRVPRVYYATRTHSQIKQVVDQLKNTSYSKARMTILSSRKQTCTNSQVKMATLEESCSFDDECLKLRKNYDHNRKREKNGLHKILEECPYYLGGIPGNENIYEQFSQHNERAWDIEDLNEYSSSAGGCSFYGVRYLHENADIIFCSYNYLLVHGIRKASKVKLTNSVLVFDEAHNIEDICRDVASIHVSQDYLLNFVLIKLERAIAHPKIPEIVLNILSKFVGLCGNFIAWMETNCAPIVFDLRRETEGHKEFSSEEIVSNLENLRLSECFVQAHKNDLRIVEEVLTGGAGAGGESDPTDENGQKKSQKIQNVIITAGGGNDKNEPFHLDLSVIHYLKDWVETLCFIFEKDKGRFNDYKSLLVKKRVSGKGKVFVFANEFRMICLNPALAFEPLKKEAHSVIVTSGTMSPLTSFESELNTPFPIKLSASHVIGPKQIWAAVASNGPQNLNLKLTKEGQNDVFKQDELGRSIVNICRIVPHGVLVFLPSYGWMEELKCRWETFPTGNPLLTQLQSIKKVFFEVTSKDITKFQKDLEDYRKTIEDNTGNGCILFAVFRGKISEGVDFKDNQARAVITCGIPYSNGREVAVRAKIEYNTLKSKQNREIISGGQWYDIQAFRAMNQAFGRCVRHAKDWGSVILIEERMTHPNKQTHLSKWVGDCLTPFPTFRDLEASLTEFIRYQEKIGYEPPALTYSFTHLDDSVISQTTSTSTPNNRNGPGPSWAYAPTQLIDSVEHANLSTLLVSPDSQSVVSAISETNVSLTDSLLTEDESGNEMYGPGSLPDSLLTEDESANEVYGPSDESNALEASAIANNVIMSSQSDQLTQLVSNSCSIL